MGETPAILSRDFCGPLSELDEFRRWAHEWNLAVMMPQRHKNGKIKPPRKNPPDALAAVRVPKKEKLVWDDETRRRAVEKLLEEEERQAAEGHGGE